MNRINQKITLFLGIIFAFLLSAGFAYALEITYPSVLGRFIGNSLGEYFCYFFSLFIYISLFITSIIIAYGGIHYLVSYSQGKFTNEGKEWIKAGILGFLIVMCATLIIQTINPNLKSCDIFGPSSLNNWFNNGYNIPPGVGFKTYNEIPIGTLTENLLTGKMDCYGFDQYGNPLDGNNITTDTDDEIPGPTYINHDRLDCLSQLIEGAQRKAQVISQLTDELINLMDSCQCSADTCSPDESCSLENHSCPTAPSCKQASGIADCCPLGVKEQIEKGEIPLPDSCGNTKEYKGLDEFRCPNPNDDENEDPTPCENIPNYVEFDVEVGGKTVTLINQENWKKLNLWQQLKYFEEKLTGNAAGQAMISDFNELQTAKAQLSRCYLAIPYVDLIKTLTATNQKAQIVLKEPQQYLDQATGEPIDVAKYCKGFNYGNSTCFQKCNNMCPDSSQQAMDFYKTCDKNCAKNDVSCLADQENCVYNAYGARPCIFGSDTNQSFADCIRTCKDSCVNNCKTKFTFCSPDTQNSSNEYKFCEQLCQNDSECILNPDNAEKCLFGTGGQAFVDCANNNPYLNDDKGNAKYCIGRAYLCKNGSDEYAGYPDCLQSSDCSSITNPSDCVNAPQCIWSSTNYVCTQNYYSAFLFSNPDWQKCPFSINLPPDTNSDCYSSLASPRSSCEELCPETTKCLSGSKCPYCPCGQSLNETTTPVPGQSTKAVTYKVLGDLYGSNGNGDMGWVVIIIIIPEPSTPGPNGNAGHEGFTQQEIALSPNSTIVPDCNEFSYNDDPLTFYCPNLYAEPNGNYGYWYNDPSRDGINTTAIGSKRVASLGQEIPVGQTVDDALNWAAEIINGSNLYSVIGDIQYMLDTMKQIGEAKDTNPIKNYCKCNAEYDNGDKICLASCEYFNVPILGEGCAPLPCQGKPCQQISNYLSNLWNGYRQFMLDFAGLKTSSSSESKRSDIIKELTYSRKSMNDCSVKSTAYGTNTRALNCTRVEDELIPPINKNKLTKDQLSTLIKVPSSQIIPFNNTVNSYCYGKNLSKGFNPYLFPGGFLSDNWFCAETYTKDKTPQGGDSTDYIQYNGL